MKIKLNSLTTPTVTLCDHCGKKSVRKEGDDFYRYTYHCGCKKLGVFYIVVINIMIFG